ncbi:SDR family NAD(P)-dependent oxidoreductase [Vibrio intestinalis]|uniref:SDR family NAD(P)-dependent oxidoreductase n=1 Tax=Vibrio intestinalis TaxID=2933291 RepID=UPI0021A28474|nr:SDR family NAD(P)-dependent oxidoreductase [Vibrio intestinalis]
MKNVLIIGGSGGIGSAIVARYAALQPSWKITATFNNHSPTIHYPNVQWIKLDATKEQQVSALAKNISHVDVLINAIGLLHTQTHQPEKSVANFEPDFFFHNVHMNTLPSLLLAKHFMSALKSKTPSHFLALSAKIGSIEDNRLGGWISYRSSKAALNMALKTISIEWRYKLPNCCVLAFHPGTTDTSLSKPFQSRLKTGQLLEPSFVAQSIIDSIERTTAEDSGSFFIYSGEKLSW